MTDEDTEPATASKWRNLPDHLNLAIAVVSLIVALVAFWVPISMDQKAQKRERSRTCVEAVVDLRSALTSLEVGYQVAPQQKADRLADWAAGGAEIERVQVSCMNVPLSSAGSVEESKPLWEQYDTERNTAREKKPPLDVLTAIRAWTIAVISDLTR
ncbi:hypothetical protein ABT301_25130 [Streptomyces sp. NPDC000987]|uniref:hypothetical protein n=1 Tax=Streptomyces sp. NPDC000987 TaxID=3154374 RepID=UPI00332A81F3